MLEGGLINQVLTYLLQRNCFDLDIYDTFSLRNLALTNIKGLLHIIRFDLCFRHRYVELFSIKACVLKLKVLGFKIIC